MLVASATTLALGAPPVALAAVAPDEIAMATLDAIVRADYGAATAQFDPTLKKRLSVNALQQSWDLYQQAFGAYQSHGDPEVIQRGDVAVVNVPLQLARMTRPVPAVHPSRQHHLSAALPEGRRSGPLISGFRI